MYQVCHLMKFQQRRPTPELHSEIATFRQQTDSSYFVFRNWILFCFLFAKLCVRYNSFVAVCYTDVNTFFHCSQNEWRHVLFRCDQDSKNTHFYFAMEIKSCFVWYVALLLGIRWENVYVLVLCNTRSWYAFCIVCKVVSWASHQTKH